MGYPDPSPKSATPPRDYRAAVLDALRERGSSGRLWAAARGYHWRTVYRVLEVWVGRTDRTPLGGIARQIVADLRADLGADLVPDVEPTADDARDAA